MSVQAGSRLGPYEVVSPLGAGGMGEVYRANDSRLDRGVALKVLPQEVASERTGVKTPTGISSAEIGWAPNGKDLWVLDEKNELRAVRPGGGEKVIARFPVSFEMPDVAPDGRVLLARIDAPHEVRGQAPGAERERSLAWLDSSWAAALSDDGRTVLLNEMSHDRVYLRRTDGSDAVPLGDGEGLALSPAADWALVLHQRPVPQLLLVPSGAGEAKVLKTPEAAALRDGLRRRSAAADHSRKRRVHGNPRPMGVARRDARLRHGTESELDALSR